MSLIAYVTRIHFADRVLEDALFEELRQLRILCPLVLTDHAADAAAHAAAGVDDPFERLCDALPPGCRAERMEVFQATEAEARLAMARAGEAGCDAVVGLGGAVALGLARRVGHGLPAQKGAIERAGARAGEWPVITIPTTTETVGLGPLPASLAGAAVRIGARTTPTGVSLVPTMVLCDPTLTMGALPEETAAAGMGALTHCIEAYLGTGWNPPADGIALDGVRRAGAHLARAVRDGRDIEARREMLASALDAGLATQKGLGAVHALAHALEAEMGERGPSRHRHGWLHASLLPPVLRFNAPAVADRYGALLQALGAPPGADLPGVIAALGASLSLPVRLDDLDHGADTLGRIARRAEEDPATRTNPRHATAADYQRILEDALHGTARQDARTGLV